MKYDLATLQGDFSNALAEMYDDYKLTYIDKSKDSYILTLKNGIVYNRGLLFESSIFPNEQPYDPVYDIHVMDRARDLPVVYKRKYNLTKVKGRTLFVYHKFQWNIYHTFLHDCNTYLNCLVSANENIQTDNVFKFANNTINQFIYDKFLKGKSVISDESFWFEELVIVNSGIVTYTNDLSVLKNQVEMLRSEFLVSKPTSSINLFTYRTKGGRKIQNIEEVKNDFTSKNFTVLSDVELCSLSLQEQATLYASAKEIFSIFDSSLYNLTFCSPGTKVIVAEPTYKHLEDNEDAFEKVCKIINANYIPILIAESQQCSRNWRDLSYNIDTATLDEYFG